MFQLTILKFLFYYLKNQYLIQFITIIFFIFLLSILYFLFLVTHFFILNNLPINCFLLFLIATLFNNVQFLATQFLFLKIEFLNFFIQVSIQDVQYYTFIWFDFDYLIIFIFHISNFHFAIIDYFSTFHECFLISFYWTFISKLYNYYNSVILV